MATTATPNLRRRGLLYEDTAETEWRSRCLGLTGCGSGTSVDIPPQIGRKWLYLQNRLVVVNRMRTAQLLPRLRGSNLNRQVELISKNSSVFAFSEPNEMNVKINTEINIEMKLTN